MLRKLAVLGLLFASATAQAGLLDQLSSGLYTTANLKYCALVVDVDAEYGTFVTEYRANPDQGERCNGEGQIKQYSCTDYRCVSSETFERLGPRRCAHWHTNLHGYTSCKKWAYDPITVYRNSYVYPVGGASNRFRKETWEKTSEENAFTQTSELIFRLR